LRTYPVLEWRGAALLLVRPAVENAMQESSC
jgi:hypothetical protein